MINIVQEFLLLYATQFSLTLGVFFVYGFILFFIQQKIHTIYFRTIGWKGILLTAWLGTPVHELSHALFAVIFRHKIHKISFFSPDKHSKRLGYVTHSYKRWNIYQRLGSFFIGGAPLIVGPLVILTLLFWLQPNLYKLISNFDLQILLQSIKDPFFWIFIYIAFAISSHIAPSIQDIRGMRHGFGLLIGLLVFTSLILLLFNISYFTIYIFFTNAIINLSFIYTFALIISLLHLVLVFGITSLKGR